MGDVVGFKSRVTMGQEEYVQALRDKGGFGPALAELFEHKWSEGKPQIRALVREGEMLRVTTQDGDVVLADRDFVRRLGIIEAAKEQLGVTYDMKRIWWQRERRRWSRFVGYDRPVEITVGAGANMAV